MIRRTSVMRLLLVVCLLVTCPVSVMALSTITNLKVSWGKRFIDKFDRRWPDLRYQSSEVGQVSSVSKKTLMRNMANSQLSFLISPFFRHYFGLSLSGFLSIDNHSLTSTISGTSTSSQLSLWGFAPGIAYEFYPFATSNNELLRSFFIGADAGLALATLTLQRRSAGTTEEFSFNNVNGPKGQVRFGVRVKAFGSRFYWLFESGIDFIRLDDLEGSVVRSGATESVTFKDGGAGELFPMTVSDSETVAGFENTPLFITQLYFAFGLSYRTLGE